MDVRPQLPDGSFGPPYEVLVVEGTPGVDTLQLPDTPTFVVPRGGDDLIELGAASDTVVFLDWCELASRDPENEIRGGEGYDVLWLPPLDRYPADYPADGLVPLHSGFEEVRHHNSGLHAFSTCSPTASPEFRSRVAGVYRYYDSMHRIDRKAWLEAETELGEGDFLGFGVVSAGDAQLFFDFARSVEQSELDALESEGVGGASPHTFPDDENIPQTSKVWPAGATDLSDSTGHVDFEASVVGDEDRTPLWNGAFPRVSVGSNRSSFDGFTDGSTASFFTGRDTIITAAHNVYDPEYGEASSNLFIPGQTPNGNPLGAFKCEVIYYDESYFSGGQPPFGDLAVGFMFGPDATKWTGPWMGWVLGKGKSFRNNWHFWNRGYPSCKEIGSDLNQLCANIHPECSGASPVNCPGSSQLFGANAGYSCTWHGDGFKDDSGWGRVIRHKCDATKGQSGSPIYTYDGDHYYVQSVHVGPKPGHLGSWNWARRLTPLDVSMILDVKARLKSTALIR